MSLFQKFNSQKELSDFVEEYLQNREQLKQKMTEGRVGESAFVEDVERLQKPITDALTLEEGDEKKTLAQLQQEGNVLQQEGNVKLDELKDELKKLKVPNTIINNTFNQGISNPLFQNVLTDIAPTQFDSTKFSLNFQNGKFLDDKFDRVKILSSSVLEIEYSKGDKQTYDLTTNLIKVLVGNTALIKSLNLSTDELRILQEIYGKNASLLRGTRSDKGKYIAEQIVQPTPTPTIKKEEGEASQSGTGKSKKRNKRKNVNSTGEFGNSMIDLGELIGAGKLKAYNKYDGRLIMNNKADNDLKDLILKKFNSYRKYNNRAIELYRRLLEKSGLKNSGGGNKGALVNKQFNALDPKILASPKQVMERLENIIGSIKAGNDNKKILNEGSNIIDFLLQKKMISKKEHSNLFNKYFS